MTTLYWLFWAMPPLDLSPLVSFTAPPQYNRGCLDSPRRGALRSSVHDGHVPRRPAPRHVERDRGGKPGEHRGEDAPGAGPPRRPRPGGAGGGRGGGGGRPPPGGRGRVQARAGLPTEQDRAPPIGDAGSVPASFRTPPASYRFGTMTA